MEIRRQLLLLLVSNSFADLHLLVVFRGFLLFVSANYQCVEAMKTIVAPDTIYALVYSVLRWSGHAPCVVDGQKRHEGSPRTPHDRGGEYWSDDPEMCANVREDPP